MWKWKEGPLSCKNIHTEVNLTLFIDILLYNIWKGITFLNVLIISSQVYSSFVLQIFSCFDFCFKETHDNIWLVTVFTVYCLYSCLSNPPIKPLSFNLSFLQCIMFQREKLSVKYFQSLGGLQFFRELSFLPLCPWEKLCD